jgi:DNA-binding transcriptional regulator YdaS (Cro superfamily)
MTQQDHLNEALRKMSITLRIERGAASQLARLIGVDPASVAHWRHGVHIPRAPMLLIKLVAAGHGHLIAQVQAA